MNRTRKLVRVTTVPLVIAGIAFSGITPASARPDPNEFQVEYYGPHRTANTQDSWWEDFLDKLAAPSFLPHFHF